MNMVYENANEAFEALYTLIMNNGADRNGTKVVMNTSFYMLHPLSNNITCSWRKWSNSYAETEWKWYLSENRSVEDIKKIAKIWDNMHNGDNIVNSNYGWQWNRNDQLNKCIEQLKANGTTRQAYITIYDGKEKDDYEFDTPCTMYIGFIIIDKTLCMNVSMRSNDLIYGFCNDQYCFSKLQKLVADKLGIETGWYYHHASDMHIYERHFNMKAKAKTNDK